MNGTEQRRQATVAQKLEQTAGNMAVLLDAVDARVFDLATKAQETRREVNELKAQLYELLTKGVYDVSTDVMVPLSTLAATWRRVDQLSAAHDTLHACVPQQNTVVGRLRWLFTGR